MEACDDSKMEECYEEYLEWLTENYSHLQIEDGDVESFETWIDGRRESAILHMEESSYEFYTA